MTQPFVPPPALMSFGPQLLGAHLLFEALEGEGLEVMQRVVGLWITEGVPTAFANSPAFYEEIRQWLGVKLDLHPKCIGLVGSARTGFSLANSPKGTFGTEFGSHSDLDLIVVDQRFFEKMSAEARQFGEDFSNGYLKDIPQRYLESNIEFHKRTIQRGFVDSWKIPLKGQYKLTCKIANTMALLTNKIKQTPEIPTVEKCSIRVDRDYISCVKQVTLNLKSAING